MVLKGGPSSVAEVVRVDLPLPGTRETLSLPLFVELREHVWNTLLDEARRAELQLEGGSPPLPRGHKSPPSDGGAERMEP